MHWPYREAAREQVRVWRYVSADNGIIREVTGERYFRAEQPVQDDQWTPTESLGARLLTGAPLQADRESANELADLFRTYEPLQTEIASTAAMAQPLPNGGVLDEPSETPAASAEVPLLSEGPSGSYWLVALTVILLTAFD